MFNVKLIAYNSAGCACESIQTITVIPSGVSNIEFENIKVFPNPANDLLSIDVMENLIGYSFEIYNSLGQIMTNQVISNIHTNIDTENYSNGFYIIKISKDDKFYNLKVIVNH